MTALVAALLAAALAPLFFVEVPAMLDYVNHLARMEILASPHPPAPYEVAWGLYPNLAMDLLVPALGRLIGVGLAAKLFLALSQVLVVSGAVAVEWAVKRRHRLGGLGAMLVLFSLPFAWGLMNFTFGMGLAAWAVAAWIGLRDRPPLLRALVHAAFVLAIFLSHFFALGVYGLTIGLIELAALSRGPWRPRQAAGLALFMAWPVLLLLAVMALLGGQIGDAATDWVFGEKLFWPLLFMNVYDVALGLLTWVVLILLVAALAFTGCLKLSRTGAWILAGYALVYLALPRRLFDVAYLDIRLLSAAGLILPAFIEVRLPKGLLRHAPLTVLACAIAFNNASVAKAWLMHQVDYREMRASFGRLSPGAAVLVARWDGKPGNAMEHQPLAYEATLAAPEAGVFVSSLYTSRGMQPLRPAPAYADLEPKRAMDFLPPHMADLRAAQGDDPAALSHLRAWPRRYRYLYVIGVPQPDPLPGRLTEVAAGRRFVLYRIRP